MHTLALEPELSEETEMQDIRDIEIDANEQVESEMQVEKEKSSLTKTKASKKGPGKRRKNDTTESLVDSIKSHRDKGEAQVKQAIK